MQKILKSFAVLGLAALVAACGGGDDFDDDVVVIEPIQPQPITGKF